MKLTDALRTAQSAEAVLDDGVVLVEHLVINEDDPDGLQLYWYDAKCGATRQHSDWFGEYCTLRDLADDLAENGIALDRLDWSPTSRAVEVSDCTCARCKAFCLAHHLLPPCLPWYARGWYRLAWWLSDTACWCRERWWLLRYRFWFCVLSPYGWPWLSRVRSWYWYWRFRRSLNGVQETPATEESEQ